MSDDILKNFVKPLIYQTQKLVGGVKRVMALPCSNPVEIYVETLVPAVLGAWYSIIEPDAKEVYHKVTGKSFVCDLTSGVEKAYKMTGGPENGVTRFIFKAAPVYDIATWWFFLADIAAEGLTDWTSMVYAQRQCNAKGDPNYGSGGGYAGAVYGGNDTSDMSFVFAPPSRFAPVSNSSVTFRSGTTGGVACSMEWTLDGVSVGVSSSLHVESHGGAILDSYSNDRGDGTGKGNAITFGKIKNTSGELMTISQHVIWAGPGDLQVFMSEERSHCTMFGAQ